MKPLSYCETFKMFYLPTKFNYYKNAGLICFTKRLQIFMLYFYVKKYGKYAPLFSQSNYSYFYVLLIKIIQIK